MMDYENNDENNIPDGENIIPYVLGSNIMQKNGENVACWGKVSSVSSSGDNFTIRTVDDVDVVVRLKSPLSEHLDGWVEVHGKAQGKNISCTELLAFPSNLTEDVDKEGHKAFVQLLTALEDPWNLGEHESNGATPME